MLGLDRALPMTGLAVKSANVLSLPVYIVRNVEHWHCFENSVIVQVLIVDTISHAAIPVGSLEYGHKRRSHGRFSPLNKCKFYQVNELTVHLGD